MHHFCLSNANHQAEVGAGLYKFINFLLHAVFSDEVQGTVICTQKVIDGACVGLGFHFEPSKVENRVIYSVCYSSANISVCESVCQHGREHQTKQRWGQDTTLLLLHLIPGMARTSSHHPELWPLCHHV